MDKTTARYHITIKTQPHASWHHPSGWTADSRRDAIEMARRADRLWMRVRLWDEVTGEEIDWSAEHA